MECILRHPDKIDGKFNSGRVVRIAHVGKLAMRIGHGKVKSMRLSGRLDLAWDSHNLFRTPSISRRFSKLLTYSARHREKVRKWPFSAPGGKSLVNRCEFWERWENRDIAQPEFVTFACKHLRKSPKQGVATGRRVKRYCGIYSENLKLPAQA